MGCKKKKKKKNMLSNKAPDMLKITERTLQESPKRGYVRGKEQEDTEGT